MALNMEALLRLRTTVEGMQSVTGLNTKLGGLQSTARNAGEGMRQMGRGAGELLSPIRALVPAVGAVGLVGMAKSAIDNADALSKMSARTGASVENLSKFQQAANLSDTSIEAVGKGLTTLGRNMVAAQDGTGKQADAFRQLGIEIVDSNGKLRSTDEVLLDIAQAFSGMEDGAEKAALANTLMGRSGEALIPMLNEGRQGIEKFTATISTEFGNKAAQFNDKMTEIGARFGELGIKLAEGLLPHLDSLADAILGIINVFMGLPGEVQAALIVFTVFGPQVMALAKILGGLIAVVKGVGLAFSGLKLGAIIAGWLPAILPALAGIIAAFKGLVVGVLAVITGPVGLTVLLIAGIVAMAVAFREPIMKFFGWFVEATRNGISGFREAWLNGWNAVLDFIRGVFKTIATLLYDNTVGRWLTVGSALLSAIQSTWTAVSTAFQSGVVQPVQRAWDSLLSFLGSTIQTATSAIGTAWGQLAAAFNQYVITPVQNGWNAVVDVIQSTASGIVTGVQGAFNGLAEFFRQAVIDPIRKVWEGMMTFMPELVNRAATALQGAFSSITAGVRGAFQGVVNSIGGIINGVIGMINRLIDGINKVRAAAQLSAIARIPNVNIPTFAQGGTVSRPTLAMVGEGGEREYIIPESKMGAASSRFLGGARGDAVLSGGAQSAAAGPAGPLVVKVETNGPITEFGGGRYVTVEQHEQGVRAGMEQLWATIRTPQGKRALGLA